jgi:protoporphyrinogen oxidase
MGQKTAIIIGAGPAGLTAAHALVHETNVKPIVYETTRSIGGICRTVNHHGNRIDIGGHRFFSKSQRVMDWWTDILPLQGAPARDDRILARRLQLSERSDAPDPETEDHVLLSRERMSRVLFRRQFFDYPLSLSRDTVYKLGATTLLRIASAYARIRLFPITEVRSLEDFFINRFGKALYQMFFKSYTEKIWGVPCASIRPEWGAQRIKGLSISAAIGDAVRHAIVRDASLDQRRTEASLIRRFLYPKYGPGQLWEEVARIIDRRGGRIELGHEVIGIGVQGEKITGVRVRNSETGELSDRAADYVISSMPVRDLVRALGGSVPRDIQRIADGLVYRDFLTVGLVVTQLKVRNETKRKTINNIIPDNWVYVQEPDVRLGRIQVFNNWSPYLVRDENTVSLGLEYFCNEGDDLWCSTDDTLAKLAIHELESIGFIDAENVLESMVIRVQKAYPAYFGTYDQFERISVFTDRFENLFLVGRNGMHRYNNQDHSMLTAMAAVDNIKRGVTTKENLWRINTELEYHEED